jgi:hypothetical protein
VLTNVLAGCLVRVRVFVGVPVVVVGMLDVLVSGVRVRVLLAIALMSVRCAAGLLFAHLGPSLVVVVSLPAGFGAAVATHPV